MFEDLIKNIEQEKKIIADLRSIQEGIKSHPENKQFYLNSANSLLHQLKILNNSVPELLKEWSPIKKFSKKEEIPEIKKKEEEKTIGISYVSPSSQEKRFVTLNKGDKKDFLERLHLSEEGLLAIKKKKKEKTLRDEVTKPLAYATISNRLFRKTSEKISPNFNSLSEDLKKANIRFLLTTYLSMAIFSILLAFSFGLFVFLILLLINPSNWTSIWVVILLPSLTAMAFYLYPASEASSIQKRITQELPFATIHMSAIAGSNISPVKIFRIIADSSEYPNVGNEIKKVISQIEIYGYDLVTALKNVALRTSNKKLGELFSGLATNISTGGSLKNYLQKKAENFLLDYKLERQKYSDLAGTFMDVYISILIAAPLVLMMMFIVMNVAGLGFGGIGITTLLFMSVIAIVLINIIFLIVLNFKQPKV